MKWLIDRLKEPSTGAGLAMAALLARSNPNWSQYADFLAYLAGFGATHAVVMPELGKRDADLR
jgi:hypothetical protein